MKKLSCFFLVIVLFGGFLTGCGLFNRDFVSPVAQIRSKQDLIDYKEGIQKKLEKLQTTAKPEEKIFVTVTLNEPLKYEKVEELRRSYNMKINRVTVRIIGEQGQKGTAMTSFSKKYEEQMEKGKGTNYKGFIEIIAYVPNQEILNLSKSKLVFLVDPSADENFVPNPEKDYVPGVFWNVEKFFPVSENGV